MRMSQSASLVKFGLKPGYVPCYSHAHWPAIQSSSSAAIKTQDNPRVSRKINYKAFIYYSAIASAAARTHVHITTELACGRPK